MINFINSLRYCVFFTMSIWIGNQNLMVILFTVKYTINVVIFRVFVRNIDML